LSLGRGAARLTRYLAPRICLEANYAPLLYRERDFEAVAAVAPLKRTFFRW